MYEIGQKEIDAVAKVIENKQFMRYRGGEGGFTPHSPPFLVLFFAINKPDRKLNSDHLILFSSE